MHPVLSATYRTPPPGARRMERGKLKPASVPVPSVEAAAPLPATVATTAPASVTVRRRLFPESDT